MVCGVLGDVGDVASGKNLSVLPKLCRGGDFRDAKMFQVPGASRSSDGGDFCSTFLGPRRIYKVPTNKE